jgi:hypothetical protein
LLSALLLLLDLPLLHFFFQKRGLRFALRTIPWHWFYHGYSGLAFAFGLVKHLLFRSRSPLPQPAVLPLLSVSAAQSLEEDR